MIIRDGTAKDALTEKSNSFAFSPSQRDEAQRCVEVLQLFDLQENSFGVAGLPLAAPVEMPKMAINGLEVSVFADLFVGLSYPPTDGEKTGMVFIRPQKRPDPDGCKTEQTKTARQEYRKEVLRYMLALDWMALRDDGVPAEQIDTKRMFGWDIRLGGEVVTFPSDRVSRVKKIEAACGQIARLWDTIEPKPSDII